MLCLITVSFIAQPPVEQPNIDVVVKSSTQEKVKEEIKEEPKQKAPEPKVVKTTYKVSEGVEQWRGVVSKYNWDVNTALRIMSCESGGNPSSLNNNPSTGDYSVGLFQINLYGNLANSRPAESWLKNPEYNIQYAHSMWKTQGFNPWSCY